MSKGPTENGAPPVILSIQSSVAYGHVGNSAATFPLMRLGVEVWPVLTVHFSNHTGYPSWRGPLLAAADVAEVVRGIADRGVLGQVSAVLSGYQGDPAVGEVILNTVAEVRRHNPAAIYCCDPVMGDVDRWFYVRAGIPALMRDRVVPAAQLITPNQFELEALTGDRKSTRLNSSHANTSYAVFCLKKINHHQPQTNRPRSYISHPFPRYLRFAALGLCTMLCAR